MTVCPQICPQISDPHLRTFDMTDKTCCLKSSRSAHFTPPLSTETTCFMSKMLLTKNYWHYRLSVLAYNRLCANCAQNALLRTKKLGSRRSTVDHHRGGHHQIRHRGHHHPPRGIFRGVCVTDRDLMQLAPGNLASPPGGSPHQPPGADHLRRPSDEATE